MNSDTLRLIFVIHIVSQSIVKFVLIKNLLFFAISLYLIALIKWLHILELRLPALGNDYVSKRYVFALCDFSLIEKKVLILISNFLRSLGFGFLFLLFAGISIAAPLHLVVYDNHVEAEFEADVRIEYSLLRVVPIVILFKVLSLVCHLEDAKQHELN